MSSERIWYEANAYAGQTLLAVGVILMVSALSLYVLLGANFIAYNVAFTVVLAIAIFLHLVLIFRHLRSL